jgi:hypothetical protein
MALTIKNLANGQLGTGSQGSLYTVGTGKAAIVKNIRVANTDTSARTFNLWFKLSGGTARMISPSAMSLGAGQLAIDDQEITLGVGDQILGDGSVASKLDYVISGIERDA